MIDELPEPSRPQLVRNILALEPLKAPVCLHGPPGVGKTELIQAIAKQLDYRCVVIHLNQMDPSDVKGFFVPDPEKRETIQYPPAALPKPDAPKTIVFLDEWGTAPEQLRKPAMELLQARRLGDYELGPQHWVMLATNTGMDGVLHEDMDTATADRMCHLYVTTDLDDWMRTYAEEADIDPRIRAFLGSHPHLFHFMERQGDSQGAKIAEETVRVTPRSWTNLSRVIRNVGELAPLAPTVTGYLGVEAATVFLEFAENVREQLIVEELLQAPVAERGALLKKRSMLELATLGFLLPTIAGESVDRAFECCHIAYLVATPEGRDGGKRIFRGEMADFIFHRLAQRLTRPLGRKNTDGAAPDTRGAGRGQNTAGQTRSLSEDMAAKKSHKLYPYYLRCMAMLGPNALPQDDGESEAQKKYEAVFSKTPEATAKEVRRKDTSSDILSAADALRAGAANIGAEA